MSDAIYGKKKYICIDKVKQFIIEVNVQLPKHSIQMSIYIMNGFSDQQKLQ